MKEEKIMEQKKTLWIIAAVGAFLLFVLGAAFIMYPKAPKVEQTVTTRTLPENKNQQNAPSISEDDGWTKNVEVPKDVTVKDLTVFSENTNVYGFDTTPTTEENLNGGETIDLNELKNQVSQDSSKQDINITVQIKDSDSKSSVTTTTENSLPKSSPEPKDDYYVAKTESNVQKPSVSKVSKTTKTNTTSAKTTATSSQSKSASATTSVAKTSTVKTQYWVQVGSYSNKKTAEDARSKLEENKVPSDIFTYKDSKGKLFYRVRVGPYTTKSEAEYWRSKIVKIDEFAKAESYIASTTTEN